MVDSCFNNDFHYRQIFVQREGASKSITKSRREVEVEVSPTCIAYKRMVGLTFPLTRFHLLVAHQAITFNIKNLMYICVQKVSSSMLHLPVISSDSC